ncbi:bacterial regulatory s, tetR family protein [Mycobacterium xenopi 3993]|nr:bacterial regulatory s, tetR family protein [Mycobacterium xenopi 3993]
MGRRGRHTRGRIVGSAAKLFVAKGFHGTSIEAIAKAVGGSRATVYQYFESKEAIFAELASKCEPAVLEHGQQLAASARPRGHAQPASMAAGLGETL